MKFDLETQTLRFSSETEVEAFHTQLTQLLRSAMASANAGVKDPHQAVEQSRQVMRACATVMRTLNVLRRALPRPESPP